MKNGHLCPSSLGNVRQVDGKACELPLKRGLWYFAARSKRPFENPIPGKFTAHTWPSGDKRWATRWRDRTTTGFRVNHGAHHDFENLTVLVAKEWGQVTPSIICANCWNPQKRCQGNWYNYA